MADNKSQIGFDQIGLGSILKQYRLAVPPNQREYAWTDEEVTQLLQDFAKAISDDEPGYFLGTIVTIPRENEVLEVVDGQQRLATTAILLAAIRDYLIGKDNVLVESIENEFLTGIDRAKRERIPNIRLNVDDNDLFVWLIARNPDHEEPSATRDSHRRLKDAYDEAKKHVKKVVSLHDEKSHGDVLNQWVSFVEQGALAVLLRVPNDANAYKMFETLNDRGLKTSQADLIKNYLFGRSGERIQEVQHRWSFMRGALETLEEENITVDFLRHALIAMRGYLREAQVYDAVQDSVKGERAAVSFASTLETLSNSYVAIFNPENEKWNGYQDSVRRAIEVFNLLNIRPMRALLMAIATKFSKKETATAYTFLVSLGVRLLLASSTRSGAVETPLAEAAYDVFEEKISDAKSIKKALESITPANGAFKEAFKIARVSKSQLARYYLRSLEMAAKGKSEPWFIPQDDRSVINLEHILPKKPDKNWPNFREDEVRMYVNRLGNQALLRASDNSDLRSGGFEDKKKVYADSPYNLTNQIAELDDWTPDEILNRQKLLADLASKAWPV